MPTPLIMALVKAEMERALSCSNISNKWCHDGIGRFLFDGFPRDIAQASAIEKEVLIGSCLLLGRLIVSQFPTPLLVIHLAAEDGVLQERCLQRGKLTGRSDDVWDIIQKRIGMSPSISLTMTDAYRSIISRARESCIAEVPDINAITVH